MKDPRESAESFASWIESREIWHRDLWQANSTHYSSIGLYRQMADFAKIQPEDKWLNLGCGFCDLEIAVLKNTKPVIITIDNNPYMLKEAAERLQQRGYPVNLSEDNEIHIMGEQQYSYFREPKRGPDFKIMDESVNVILDDIRNLTLKKSLKGSIDVVTYSLSGVSVAAVAQPPFKLDFEPGKLYRISERKRIEYIYLVLRYWLMFLEQQFKS